MSYVKGPSYAIRVVEGLATPKVNGREVTVGAELLRLDASLGVMGESLASLLLPAVDYSSDLASIVKSYRTRVVVEEASEAITRLGPLAGLAKVPPYFFPIARMSKLSWLYSCIFNESTRNVDLLGEIYSDYAKLVGDLTPEGYVKLSESKVKGSVASLISGIVKSVAAGISVAGAYMSFFMRSSECPPNVLLEDPYRTVVIPEGILFSSCRWTSHPVELEMERATCRRSSLLYSSLLCEDGNSRAVIKDYGYGTFKWLFAGVVSITAYPFIQTPSGRASNEYRRLLELRQYVRTPRVLALCINPMEASMVRDYVDGSDVLRSRDPAHWQEAGRVLATVHRSGYALGDPNPSNVVIGRDGAWLIDVEQAGKFTPQRGAWDLAVFFYYSRFFGAPLDLVKESLRSYASSLEPSLWKKVRGQLFSARLAPFLASLPLLFFELRSAVESIKP
ncbi:hypothetical protein ASAC_0519 [Acidilobus saccharovorans 345-15]|uniref:Mn2+-dependent serine/threonine protein kinase n=1 Tax=Acidilobus saccharovorans (strain DSM 16705 / JCM 18335 / VKM B-2471 / 345-15) TaxID=666510 RepID=D9Q0T8_ACIS3|nr:hypothetical protein [Acidilobus saccharovorans]ADL18926.1 hypothetical protein ASAC_0519 [Acidilobus saccharovorans 345-15]